MLDSDRLWSRFILKLNQQHPFFAATALHARLTISSELSFAHTSGRNVQVGRQFLAKHTEEQQFSFILHQILHLALQHNERGEHQRSDVWNVAADIVVNDIISECTDWPLAPETAWDTRYKNQSVEAVYRDLIRQQQSIASMAGQPDDAFEPLQPLPNNNGQSDEPQDGDGHYDEQSQGKNGRTPDGYDEAKSDSDRLNSDSSSSLDNPSSNELSGLDSASSGAELDAMSAHLKRYQSQLDLTPSQSDEKKTKELTGDPDSLHWRIALQSAKLTMEQRREYGSLPLGLKLEYELAVQTQLNWRTLLWQHVCQSQDDYGEFDRRFIHQGLYLEQLDTVSLNIAVIVDTSGSIGSGELNQFMVELRAISALYPSTRLSIYFADVDLYGPFESVGAIDQMPNPIGGGGTDFRDALRIVDGALTDYALIIYFTDGFGEYPIEPPRRPLLWVLTELGIEEESVPFGQCLRIAS